MKTFLLNISSPDGKLFSGQVVSLIVRGVEGEFAVLAEHVPFITNVVPGKCRGRHDHRRQGRRDLPHRWRDLRVKHIAPAAKFAAGDFLSCIAGVIHI